MEIHPDEILRSKNNPLELFYSSIKAEATKTDYERKLKKVLCEFFRPILKGDPELINKQKSIPQIKKKGIKRKFSDADFEVRAAEFVRRAQEDNDWAEDVLMKLGQKFKERANLPKTDPDYINPVSLKNYFVPVQKLLEMNRVNLSWKRIRLTFPELDGKDETREYTYDEIQKMLHHCKVMDKVLVLLAASSGIRAGAFSIKWKHIIPIYLHDEKFVWEDQDVTESVVEKDPVVAAMIRIYANSNSEYIAFTTPECWSVIQEYRSVWIKDVGKPPQPDDPFFKKSGPFVRELTDMGLRKRMERILKDSGIRPPLSKGQRRHKVPAFNGFRRFFNKANKKSFSSNSVLASLIFKETMMGHGGLIQLDKNYFKSHIYELIEEYVNAIPNLTISDEERERIRNVELSEENASLRKKQAEIQILEKRIEEVEKSKGKSIQNAAEFLNEELVKRDATLKEMMEKMAHMSKELKDLKKSGQN